MMRLDTLSALGVIEFHPSARRLSTTNGAKRAPKSARFVPAAIPSPL